MGQSKQQGDVATQRITEYVHLVVLLVIHKVGYVVDQTRYRYFSDGHLENGEDGDYDIVGSRKMPDDVFEVAERAE